MDLSSYLDKFQTSTARLDSARFSKDQLDYKCGRWLRSVVLKFQKKAWADPLPAAKPFEGSIFCSIWVNETLIQQGRLNYNIHALKLRELKGYAIQSREFAEAFRSRFKPFSRKWPNVSVDFGPLNLMEGWAPFDETDLEPKIQQLAYQFLELAPIIDDLLAKRKKPSA
jgi:hypothetical protein